MIVRKENDLFVAQKHASKHPYTSSHKDVCIIEDGNDCPSQAPVGGSSNLNESNEPAENM